MPRIRRDTPNLSTMMVDATIDDAALDRLIACIKRHLGAHGHMLLIYEPGSEIPSFFRTSLSKEYVDLYTAHYQQEDRWLSAGRALPASHVLLGQEYVPDRDWVRSVIWHEFARHIDHRHLLGLTDHKAGGSWIGLGMHRSTRAGPFDLAQKNWLIGLIPPLRSLFRVRSTVAGLRSAARVGDAVLDLISVPAVLVDAAARVVMANTACLRLATASATVRMRGSPHESGIWVASDAASQWLRQAVSQVALGNCAAMERPFHYDQDQGKPMLISVMRVSDRVREFIPRSDLALVLFFGPGERVDSFAARLAVVYRLTAAEARVVEALAGGETPSEIAEHCNLSIATVRTHLKHAFDKTGTRRQTELVSLALHYMPL